MHNKILCTNKLKIFDIYRKQQEVNGIENLYRFLLHGPHMRTDQYCPIKQKTVVIYGNLNCGQIVASMQQNKNIYDIMVFSTRFFPIRIKSFNFINDLKNNIKPNYLA